MAKIGRLLKERMLAELAEALKDSPNVLIASMGPLKSADTDTLRKRLRSSQARMFVTKRTLGTRGVSTLSGADGLAKLIAGSVAFVIPGEDIVKTAKIIVDFAKANEGKLIVRGGLVEGQVLNDKSVEEMASLPSRLQLIANVVGALVSPFTSLILALEHHMSDLAWVVEEAAKHKPAETSGGAANKEG